MFRSFLNIFVQVPQCHFFWGGGATTTRWRRRDDDKSEITWPLPHHTQGPNTSWGTPSLWLFLKCSFFFSAQNRFCCLIFWETGPSLWKYRPRSTFCPEKWTDLIPGENGKNRDLGISENPNIDEVDGIYLASSRGLRWGKTKPPDYILMVCSANVPGISYTIMFGYFCYQF